MEVDLNVNLKSAVRKGSLLNDWRNLIYVTKEKLVISLENRGDEVHVWCLGHVLIPVSPACQIMIALYSVHKAHGKP